jgi:arylsulfatase A-like enzyme
MQRSHVLQLLAVSFAAILPSLPAVAETNDARAKRPPSFLFILTDDQRFDSLGCMGNPVIRTPHIDRIASDGVVFDNAFVTTSICAISRASFMLGQYERRHRIDTFRAPYSPEQLAASFPLLLRANGYRTGLIGKWGIGGPLPEDAYDYWRGYAGQGSYFPPGEQGVGKHLTDTMGEQALEFLDGCSPDRPFLLQLYTKAAHCQDNDPWPFQPAPRYNALYEDITIPPPPTATDAHFAALPELLQTSEGRTRWLVRHRTPELNQKSLKDYYRLISQLDDWVGAIVRKLHERGLADNTIIVYSADNGMFLGDRGLADKWFMYEESIRVPLIVHDPRLAPDQRGRRRKELALNIDVAPTILDLAGVRIPAAMQGESLVPLLRGETVPWRDEFLYEHRISIKTIPKSEGVRTTRWKYVRYTESDPLVEELYDLQTDPLEERNLANTPQHAERLESMRAKWEELCRSAE